MWIEQSSYMDAKCAPDHNSKKEYTGIKFTHVDAENWVCIDFMDQDGEAVDTYYMPKEELKIICETIFKIQL